MTGEKRRGEEKNEGQRRRKEESRASDYTENFTSKEGTWRREQRKEEKVYKGKYDGRKKRKVSERNRQEEKLIKCQRIRFRAKTNLKVLGMICSFNLW